MNKARKKYISDQGFPGVLQKIPIKCARIGRKNRDGTVGKP
jgi:hypothetical protein